MFRNGRARLARITSRYLLAIPSPALFAIGLALAILLAEAIAAATSLAMIGEVPKVIWVAAFIAPCVVASLELIVLIAIIDQLREQILLLDRAEADLRRDIAARQQAEESLRQRTSELARSNAELEQFAYVASHDLQEPLRTITSFIQLVERKCSGGLDEEAREYIRFAVGGTHRMRQLIRDLLLFSRIGTEGRPFAATNLETVLDIVAADLGRAIAESDAVVTHDPLPVLEVDRAQMTSLLHNLIGNAIKYRRADVPPLVHVGAEPTENGWLLSVRDNGIGIDPAHFERIFVIFQRLHGQDRYEGTGVGLAVCKKIVERHGGRIWVRSEPGKGAIFFIALPIAGNAATLADNGREKMRD